MTITILTLFPDLFSEFITTSIIKKAQEKKLIKITLVNIRDFATDRYKSVDDRPYGGGVGMILRVDILHKALEFAKQSAIQQSNNSTIRSILLDPKGKRFNQQKANELSKFDHLILVCGHYEGVDARIEKYIDEKISIGDFVLTGGELPAMAVIDGVIRLIPGVLKPQATADESFSTTNDQRPTTTLEYPQYTRPEVFDGQKVPDVLLSGNHKAIEAWKRSKQKKAKHLRNI